LKSVVIAHKIVHNLHKSGVPGVIIKRDYEKTYDRVDIDFLMEILKGRGFGDVWCKWISMVVTKGSVCVATNEEESGSFKTGKGLRQGDPLSPLLFNLVGDVLNGMLVKASERGLTSGLMRDFRPTGVLSLQYADDTLLFMSSGGRCIRNLRVILSLFEKVSRMKINFHKSEIIPLNLEPESVHEISHLLHCPVGSLPFSYLGVPIHFERLRRGDLQPVINKLIKKIAGWRDRLMAYSSRLTLIKTCLSSVSIYLMTFIKFPKWTIRLVETQMAHCLWTTSEDKHNYHLVNWRQICMKKEFGGPGVPDLRDLNLCLLGSWIRRYAVDKEKIWKILIDFKYNTNKPNIFTCRPNGASNF
jgi:hypothetical protein